MGGFCASLVWQRAAKDNLRPATGRRFLLYDQHIEQAELSGLQGSCDLELYLPQSGELRMFDGRLALGFEATGSDRATRRNGGC